MENLYVPNCIRTFSGIYMNVFEPTLDMICIEDIAHSLSQQCRFGGHLPTFYSVAQHSILSSYLVPDENRLAALMHDSSEAYLLDMPKPIKVGLDKYNELEYNLMSLISTKFGFKFPLHPRIKQADKTMLEVEWNQIMLQQQDGIIEILTIKAAKKEFLRLFKLYTENK